jgi:hypothetical protein
MTDGVQIRRRSLQGIVVIARIIAAKIMGDAHGGVGRHAAGMDIIHDDLAQEPRLHLVKGDNALAPNNKTSMRIRMYKTAHQRPSLVRSLSVGYVSQIRLGCHVHVCGRHLQRIADL